MRVGRAGVVAAALAERGRARQGSPVAPIRPCRADKGFEGIVIAVPDVSEDGVGDPPVLRVRLATISRGGRGRRWRRNGQQRAESGADGGERPATSVSPHRGRRSAHASLPRVRSWLPAEAAEAGVARATLHGLRATRAICVDREDRLAMHEGDPAPGGGDHAGLDPRVNTRTVRPRPSMIATCSRPRIRLTTASRLPSGDQLGPKPT